MVNSKPVEGVKLGDCSVLIGYQANEFTHTLVGRKFVFLITHLPFVHWQGVNTYPHAI